MRGSCIFVLAVFPFISRVSAFARCDSSIILNIENSYLTPFPYPKPALFSNTQFKYDYVSCTDQYAFQSAEIIFQTATNDDTTVVSTLNRYLGGSTFPVSNIVTFFDIGDTYEVNAKGFIDCPSSNNQVYLWTVEGVIVVYYCSLDSPILDGPLFSLNTPTDLCEITPEQLTACEASITMVNNYVSVPLSKLAYPPTSIC